MLGMEGLVVTHCVSKCLPAVKALFITVTKQNFMATFSSAHTVSLC